MKSFARIWFLSCLLAMSFAAGADDTAQILEQEQRFSDAIRGDWDALEVLLHEEFFYNTSDGTTIDKKPFIALMRSGAVQIGNLARLDTRVYFHGPLRRTGWWYDRAAGIQGLKARPCAPDRWRTW